MSRRSRHEYQPSQTQLLAVPRAKKRYTLKSTAEYLQREIKRRAVADGHIKDPATMPAKHTWFWCSLDHKGGIVLANTRSEARARVKAVIGTDKLPKDLLIVHGLDGIDLSRTTAEERARIREFLAAKKLPRELLRANSKAAA